MERILRTSLNDAKSLNIRWIPQKTFVKKMEKSHESIMLQLMRVISLFSFSKFIYNANFSSTHARSSSKLFRSTAIYLESHLINLQATILSTWVQYIKKERGEKA